VIKSRLVSWWCFLIPKKSSREHRNKLKKNVLRMAERKTLKSGEGLEKGSTRAKEGRG